MKIQVKISGSQLEALYNLSEAVIVRDLLPKTIAHKMVKALLLEVHTKLHGKALFPKGQISFSLTPAQGYAFIWFWNEIDLKKLPYEGAIVRYIISQIDQKL